MEKNTTTTRITAAGAAFALTALAVAGAPRGL